MSVADTTKTTKSSRSLVAEYKASVAGKYRTGLAVSHSQNGSVSGVLSDADRAFAESEFDRCISLCSEAISHYGEASVRVFLLRGNASLQSGAFAQAVSDFDHALVIDPVTPTAYLGRALAYLGGLKFAEACREFEKYESIEVVSADNLLKWGTCLLALHRFADAVSILTRALNTSKSAPLLMYRATAYESLGDSASAAADYATIRKEFPRYIENYTTEEAEAEQTGRRRHQLECCTGILKLLEQGTPNYRSFLEKKALLLAVMVLDNGELDLVQDAVATLDLAIKSTRGKVPYELIFQRSRLFMGVLRDPTKALSDLGLIVNANVGSHCSDNSNHLLDALLARSDIRSALAESASSTQDSLAKTELALVDVDHVLELLEPKQPKARDFWKLTARKARLLSKLSKTDRCLEAFNAVVLSGFLSVLSEEDLLSIAVLRFKAVADAVAGMAPEEILKVLPLSFLAYSKFVKASFPPSTPVVADFLKIETQLAERTSAVAAALAEEKNAKGKKKK